MIKCSAEAMRPDCFSYSVLLLPSVISLHIKRSVISQLVFDGTRQSLALHQPPHGGVLSLKFAALRLKRVGGTWIIDPVNSRLHIGWPEVAFQAPHNKSEAFISRNA
jgi:hypothetical protein